MKRLKRTYIIPLIATGAFILGLISLFVPFLPFGWFLLIMTAIILTPYFKPMKKFLAWIIKKDRTGIFEKARKKVVGLYRWAGDKKRAKEMNEFCAQAATEKSKA